MAGEQTALYRFFDDQGVLLYVGVSGNPVKRWVRHAGDKPWWPQVQRIELAWYDDRDLAPSMETEAIRKERPRYNKQVSQQRARHPRPGCKGTQHRSVRIKRHTWDLADAAAKSMGPNRSRLINDLIRCWLARPGADYPDRPPAELVERIEADLLRRKTSA